MLRTAGWQLSQHIIGVVLVFQTSLGCLSTTVWLSSSLLDTASYTLQIGSPCLCGWDLSTVALGKKEWGAMFVFDKVRSNLESLLFGYVFLHAVKIGTTGNNQTPANIFWSHTQLHTCPSRLTALCSSHLTHLNLLLSTLFHLFLSCLSVSWLFGSC